MTVWEVGGIVARVERIRRRGWVGGFILGGWGWFVVWWLLGFRLGWVCRWLMRVGDL